MEILKGRKKQVVLALLFVAILMAFIFYSAEVPEKNTDIAKGAVQVIDLGEASAGKLEMNVVSELTKEGEAFLYVSPFKNVLVDPFIAMSNLSETFDNNYQLAQDGDGDSMNVLSQVLLNCSSADRIFTVEQLDDLIQQGMLVEAHREPITALIPDCTYIQSLMPDDVTVLEWADWWRTKAIDEGVALAQLYALSYLEKSVINYQMTAKILEEAVKSKEYQSYYEAYAFYQKYSDPGNDDQEKAIQIQSWLYLACSNQPECDEKILVGNLKLELYPHQVEEVLTGAENLEIKLSGNEKMDFVGYRTIEELKENK